ncbi:MAG: hypothetical protein AB7F32_02435 [Victivallaceae bacterium]
MLSKEQISKVFADDETMIADGRRRPALSGFTLGGKARKVGQAGRGELFSALQRALKLAPKIIILSRRWIASADTALRQQKNSRMQCIRPFINQ